MKKKSTLIMVFLGLSLLGLGWAYRVIQGNDKTVKRRSLAVPVVAARAEKRDIPLLLEVVGRTEAYESVTLKARVDGQVAAVAFAEGRHVRKGEVLVRLDPNDFSARQKQAEANLARNHVQLAKARADLARYLSLKERGFVSEEKVNEFRTAEAAASAAVRADRAAAELARLQHSYTTVRAPFSGIVGARLVSPGAAVKANDTALAVVNRVQPLHVVFAVAERHLPLLRASQARGGLHAIVTVPGDNGQRFEGRVSFIDNVVDAATGTVRVKALLDNREERLVAGQFLNVSLALEILRQVVVVPVEAVQQGTEGPFLFVVRPDQTVVIRKVVPGAAYQGMVPIGQEVAAGEVVVTDGQLRLTPGAAVQVKMLAPGNGAAHVRQG